MSTLTETIFDGTTTGEGSIGRCHACGCVGPNPGYEIMDNNKILEEMKTLIPNLWSISADGKYIHRTFVCKNWKSAIDCINKLSDIAEREDIQHHPDISLTKYRTIEIKLWTHAVNGMTSYDFKLARGIDSICIDYSPKWLREHPEALVI